MYNTASGATALLERHEYDVLKMAQDGSELVPDNLIDTLLYGGFLRKSDTDELEELRSDYNRERYDHSRMVLTIAPTLACNFGCDYCFQGAKKPSGAMAEDVQDAVAELVTLVAGSIRRLGVSWYGGEPLLARSVIEHLSDRLIAGVIEMEYPMTR